MATGIEIGTASRRSHPLGVSATGQRTAAHDNREQEGDQTARCRRWLGIGNDFREPFHGNGLRRG